MIDGFESAAEWTAAPSDGVTMRVSSGPGLHGNALRIDYQMHGGGYAIVRRTLDLTVPANYAFSFAIRGKALRNNLEFKLVDPSGENVWWSNQRDFEFPTEWRSVIRRKRHISFAWGPKGGGELERVAAIEIAITAGKGGSGTVWLDDLTLETLPPPGPPPRPVAMGDPSSSLSQAVDGDSTTAWRPTTPNGDLTLDLGVRRELGGLRIDWADGVPPERYRVSLSPNGTSWRTARTVVAPRTPRAWVWLPESEARYVRIGVGGGVGTPGIAEAAVLPVEWAPTPNDYAAVVARDAPRGAFPRGLLGEQPYWTAIGVERDSSEGLFNEDGALEPFGGRFSLEPFMRVGDSLYTWADVDRRQALERGYLPLPGVVWRAPAWTLEIAPFVAGDSGRATTYATYSVRNLSDDTLRATLALAVRPFQVNPPWQFLQTPGGVAPTRSIVQRRGSLVVDGRHEVRPLTAPSAVLMTTLDRGDIAAQLRAAARQPATQVRDSTGYASAALLYDVELAPGVTREIVVAVPESLGAPNVARSARAVSALRTREVARWTARLGSVDIVVPDTARRLVETLRASLASMLIMRDGFSLKPGARSYSRSWIRDGAMMSAALLRLGLDDVVRDYATWYARFQYPNGKVPCCVDDRGADPVPEHDSHGELVFLIAEYVRFTGDRAFAARLWPRVKLAVSYVDSLRASRRTPEFQEGDKRAYFGLMPPSISHEGYSAKPVHSYWDDFWTLRGLKDAAWLAELLNDPEARAYAERRDEFRRDLSASIAAAMQLHRIDFIPGSADLGDFDATSTTIAVAPVDEPGVLPPGSLDRTFDKWLDFFRQRRDGRERWENYTPYELREVGTLVRMGRPEQAREALDFYLGDQRPAAWRQWAEVVWRDPATPKFIGDLPHAWVASDYARSFLDFFAYERDADSSLVLAAGVDPAWLSSPQGVGVSGLRTHYGTLTYALREEGDALVLTVSGVRVPPGGLYLPGFAGRRFTRWSGNGVVELEDGGVRIRSVPARVELR